MFAKIDSIDILILLFKDRIVITPRIRDEISTFNLWILPLTVTSTIKTVPLTHKALEEYVQLQENVTLGRGELEAIAYCKAEKCIFVTNDRKARELAKAEGVLVISFQALLKALWKKKLKTKEEVRKIFEMIKEADNLWVSKEVEREIFE